MHRADRQAALSIAIFLLWTGPSWAVETGEPLARALDELRAAGLKLIFSSALIDPSFTVTADPGVGPPEEVARRILAPYGLTLDPVRPQLFAVVKRAPGADAASAPATPRAQPETMPQAEPEPPLVQVDVYASRYAIGQQPAQPGAGTELTRKDLEMLPGLEQDATRAMRYLPGTASAVASARSHVRGGREDEVAMFFDGVPLYEPFHYKDVQALLGILDPETVSSFDFFSGVVPSRYGNRMSGVLDIKPRTWSGSNYNALGMSLLYSEGLTQGRLESQPLEWLGAIRRSNVDFTADLLGRHRVEPNFLDALGRVQYDLGEHGSIAAGYLMLDDGLDVKLSTDLELQHEPGDPSTAFEQARIRYRDTTGWFTWHSSPSDRTETHFVLSRTVRNTSRTGSLNRLGSAQGSLDDLRQFDTTTARLEAATQITPRWRLIGGLELYDYLARYDYSRSSTFDPYLAAAFARKATTVRVAHLGVEGQAYAGYLAALVSLTANTTLDVGGRWDLQRYRRAFRDDQVSPRLSLQHRYSPDTVLRLSWGQMSQTQRPDELQVQDGDVRFYAAERATQTVVSLDRRVSKDAQVRVEVFDKHVAHPRPDYENLLSPFAVLPELEIDRNRVRPDSSRAYGAEFSLHWSAGERWSGWASYSWSEATDRFGALTVPRTWDQKHAIAAGVAWHKSPWLLSVGTMWHTGWRRNELLLGNLSSVPAIRLKNRNAQSWPDYFSLDLRAAWTHPLPKGNLQLFAEVIDATNHRNFCCTNYQLLASRSPVLLEQSTSVWVPRFAIIGVTWELP